MISEQPLLWIEHGFETPHRQHGYLYLRYIETTRFPCMREDVGETAYYPYLFNRVLFASWLILRDVVTIWKEEGLRSTLLFS